MIWKEKRKRRLTYLKEKGRIQQKKEILMNPVRKILSRVCLFAGIMLLILCMLGRSYSEYQAQSAIRCYEENVEQQDEIKIEMLWNAAVTYNEQLSSSRVSLKEPFAAEMESSAGTDYDSLLSMDESGLMGVIEIPKIHVRLPIFHGTGEEILKKGIGHLEGSSLPVGGEGSHTVLAGHTGCNNARMFDDLDELEEGDFFHICILGKRLVYRVSEIAVVEPSDVSRIGLQPGRDLCTLVTCTPYGINSHRLLVTGVKMEESEKGLYMNQEKLAKTNEKRFFKASGWLLFWRGIMCAGILLFLLPAFSNLAFLRQSEKYIRIQKEKIGQWQTESSSPGKSHLDELYQEARLYNEKLRNGSQMDKSEDFWQSMLPVLTQDLDGTAFGLIEIPKMHVKLPLFLGASEENLSQGAAILEQTSLPLGEKYSNTVIAGHRGYRGKPFFREIEKLTYGDLVYVTTPWDTYIYRVESTEVIESDQTDVMEIHESREMVTLLTCHPYLSHGKQRYVVYCIRENTETEQEGMEFSGVENAKDNPVVTEDHVIEASPFLLMEGEKIFRITGVIVILAAVWNGWIKRIT